MNLNARAKATVVLSLIPLAVAGTHDPGTDTEKHPRAGRKIADPCTLVSLTDRCRFFDPNNPQNPYRNSREIVLNDGTRIPNPLVHEKLDAERRRDRAVLDRAQVDFLALNARDADRVNSAKSEILDLFQTLDPDGKKFSSRYRVALTDLTNANPLSSTLPDWEIVLIPSPMSSGEKTIPLSLREGREQLRKAVGEDAFAKMQKTFTRGAVANSEWNYRRANQDAFLEDALFRKEDEEQRVRRVAREPRIRELWAFAQAQAVGVVTKGKPRERWTEAERVLAERLERVILHLGSEVMVRVDPLCSGAPEARYVTMDNSVRLCEAANELPDLALVQMMSHELFHAVDPCDVQFPLYDVDKVAVEREMDRVGTLEASALEREPLVSILASLHSVVANGSTSSCGHFSIDLPPSALEAAKKKGLLKLAIDAKPNDYALQRVFDCLTTEAGGGFVSQVPAAREAFAKSVGEFRAKSRGADPNREHKRIRSPIDQFPECFVVPHSEMAEAVADWGAGEVTGKFVENRELKDPADKLALVAILASIDCYDRLMEPAAVETPGIVIASAVVDQKRMSSEHPVAQARIDRVLLKNKKVRKALGCNADAEQPCNI